jgi:hypothetical protein
MGFSPGEESLRDGVAAQAIEAQPVFGQIKPSRGLVARVRWTASSGEHVPGIDRQEQEAGQFKRRERDHGVDNGGLDTGQNTCINACRNEVFVVAAQRAEMSSAF